MPSSTSIWTMPGHTHWAGKRLPTDDEWHHAAQLTALKFGPMRVWNWTESELSDGHTRFCMLKGGWDYEPRDRIGMPMAARSHRSSSPSFS